MKKQAEKLTGAATLREKAEEQLKLKQTNNRLFNSESDMLKLIHELEVHQIEMEMQNEELVVVKEKAERAEEKYTELYDFAPTGYITLSKRGEITKINFAGARMLHKDRSDLVKNTFALFVSENTRAVFSNFLENIFKTNVKRTCEVILSIKDNLPVFVIINGIVSPNEDICLLTLVDITQIKLDEINLLKEKEKTALSELKFKGIINSVADAIFSYNPDNFEIIETNEATSKVYGYEMDELIGMSCLKFSAEEDKSKVGITEAHQKGAPFMNLTHHKKKDGTAIIVQIQSYKIFINKKPLIFAVSHDITNIKKKEEELITAKERAEESDRLKSAFLANMSHEIRTPMNGILGFANLLKEVDLKSEKQQEYITIIEKSGDRMLNIINEIMDISKIESGQMNIFITDVDINKCLEDSYLFFKHEAERKNIELKLTKVLNTNEIILKTDLDKLNSILFNLIKNAIKYTMQGTVEFGYGLNNSKNELEFFVKDTGIGIPKDRQLAIFERFIQADIEDKMAHQGAGLGLTISKAFVEMLGGGLWLESELNVGTTFYFTLPYKNDTISEIVSAEATIGKQKELKNLKILIVEDDEISNALITVMVSELGKEIISVTTGYDAIEACKNNPDIDLILMDIQLPIMNGYDATMQIREFNKKVIIIAQTAYALSGDREKSISKGCNDYISKPFKIDELRSLIHKYF